MVPIPLEDAALLTVFHEITEPQQVPRPASGSGRQNLLQNSLQHKDGKILSWSKRAAKLAIKRD